MSVRSWRPLGSGIGSSNSRDQPRSVSRGVVIVFKAGRQPWRALPSLGLHIAGHAGATAFARLLATPRPLGMVLANPTTPIAARAHGHIGGRIVDDGQ